MRSYDSFTTFAEGDSRSDYHKTYTFKRKQQPTRRLPDLVVTKIYKPQWDRANRRSIIKAVVKNIGNAPASLSIARMIDPSTSQPTGAPYNATYTINSIAAGASKTVVFYLPYWVYNPDAELEVTADYKGTVTESNENNNMKEFFELG